MPCLDENDLVKYADGLLPPAARARVERHLDACRACSALLAEFGRLRDPVVEATPERVAGRFELLGPVGEGAMGRVYAAFDHGLGRRVALKLLRPGNAQHELLAEARAMARLAHPNVVGVYDAFDDNGRLALAMELVEGETLARLFARSRPPWAEALALYLQAGKGLQAAHDVGLIHRDFKPQNVLVDREGRVRVTDFGLALYAIREGAPAEFAGTPAYMAPEQLLGRPAGARSDQFAFCVALYEAVYQSAPFAGTTLEERLWSTMQGPKPPPPDAEAPRWLFDALRRGLAPRPEDRHASMRSLLDAVEGVPLRAAERHVHANIVVSIAMAVFQLTMAAFGAVLWRLGAGATPDPAPPDPAGTSTPEGALVWAFAGLFIAAGAYGMGSVMTGWGPLGGAWAILNAYGLAKRKPWARASAVAYGAVSALTCFGTPYGLYALYSLTRPNVRALFGKSLRSK